MNRKPSNFQRPGPKPPPRPKPRPARPEPAPLFEMIDRTALEEERAKQPFRILIAVHRPRFRGRAERAAAREGWLVTSLLTRQDPVGQVSKPPSPPQIVVLSHDFGRQKDLAIFRAVQKWRSQGMILIGLVEDCEIAPETHPDSVPNQLCDVCLTPPVKTADFNALFAELYEAIKGEPAPPMKRSGSDGAADEEED